MEMLGKIRRMYFRDKLSLHQIAKRTGLSRNTIRKRVRAPEATQPAYQRCATFNKLNPFHETLEQALKADSFRPKHNRRSAKTLFEQIKRRSVLPDLFTHLHCYLFRWLLSVWREIPSLLATSAWLWP